MSEDVRRFFNKTLNSIDFPVLQVTWQVTHFEKPKIGHQNSCNFS
jgi:hypothetical protein